MFYRLLADFIVLIHFLWILFMLWGFGRTIWAIIKKDIKFLQNRFIRTFHLLGILVVGFLIIIGKPCFLTVWEIKLRVISGVPSYTGSFIVHYIEKLVYPDVHPLVVEIPSVIIGGVTLLIYILLPPWKRPREGDGAKLY